MRTTLITLGTILTIATAAAAQQAQPPVKAVPSAEVAARPGSSNVRIELTITDQRAEGAAVPKTILMLVEDHQSSRIRTGRNNVALNIDARPEIMRDGRIRVSLSLEYVPQSGDNDRSVPLAISQTIAALLEDGQPLLVSQSADPSSERRVKVELKATVVK